MLPGICVGIYRRKVSGGDTSQADNGTPTIHRADLNLTHDLAQSSNRSQWI